MSIIEPRRVRDEKIAQMRAGQSVYVESAEVFRLLQRAIKRESLNVIIDRGPGGYWFMLENSPSTK